MSVCVIYMSDVNSNLINLSKVGLHITHTSTYYTQHFIILTRFFVDNVAELCC